MTHPLLLLLIHIVRIDQNRQSPLLSPFSHSQPPPQPPFHSIPTTIINHSTIFLLLLPIHQFFVDFYVCPDLDPLLVVNGGEEMKNEVDGKVEGTKQRNRGGRKKKNKRTLFTILLPPFSIFPNAFVTHNM